MYFLTKNKYIGIFSLLISALLFVACASESEGRDVTAVDGKAMLELKLPSTLQLESASASDPEAKIADITLFVFDSATGNKEFGVRLDIPYSQSSTDVDMSRWANDQIITIINSSVLSNLAKARNIHVVANISAGKLATIGNENDLKALLTDPITSEIAGGATKPNFVMHGASLNHNFVSIAKATVSLVRNVAKLNMKINTEDFHFGGATIVLAPDGQDLSVKVVNVANRSYLVGRASNPTTVDYLSYIPKVHRPVRAATKSESALSAYINENLRTTFDIEKNVTYLLLQIPYKITGSAEVKNNNFYKILINKENSYAINRNTIYDMVLNINSLGGDAESSAVLLNATLNILDWTENTILSDITQTYLTVEGAVLPIAAKYDMTFGTNVGADQRSLILDNLATPWFTASITDDTKISLIAKGDGYTVPRSATFSIKAGNLTKKITVNQKAVPVKDGSISLNPRKIYLSEIAKTKTVSLVVNPTTDKWSNIASNASVASFTPASGTGSATIKFTAGQSYSNDYFKFLSEGSLAYDSVQVCNLHLEVPADPLGVPGVGGSFTEPEFKAQGGDAKWVVTDKPTWVTSATSVDGALHYTVSAEPNENDREGEITIAHINDLNYKKTIKIKQSAKYIRFPEFDYLVIRFFTNTTVNGNWDLDTATELEFTGLNGLDRQPVGYGMGASARVPRKYKGYRFLEYGGDNRVTGYETVLIDMYNLCNTEYPIYEELPRYFAVNIYAIWFIAPPEAKTIDVEMVLYRGGTMEADRTYDYKNVGGKIVHTQREKLDVLARGNMVKTFRTSFTPVGSIVYDKLKNTANMTMRSVTQVNPNRRSTRSVKSNASSIPTDNFPSLRNGESKDGYEVRLNEYYNKIKK